MAAYSSNSLLYFRQEKTWIFSIFFHENHSKIQFETFNLLWLKNISVFDFYDYFMFYIIFLVYKQ